ncbi:rhodanese-like domain-containing protein [Nitriliruptoraceae bacterium ZYF776]|nr:rhodanese-like domain-containing protein [Profundirhabdus halotolerans]
MPAPVTDVPAAAPERARDHFAALLALETDCADVHAALGRPDPGFLLLDVRSPQRYAAGHLPDAVNLPHGRITRRTLSALPEARRYVVYCAGPHCNGADRAALRLAELGQPVKKMIGGVVGWREEGLLLER